MKYKLKNLIEVLYCKSVKMSKQAWGRIAGACMLKNDKSGWFAQEALFY